MHSKTLVVISDLHIGGDKVIEDFRCEKELIALLDHLETLKEPLELVILGDFFDLWKVESDIDNQIEFILKQRPKLFARFKEFGTTNKITVLAGNHDHALAYNRKYKEDLKKYNIHVDTNQFFEREFAYNNKKIKLIGEHGNQVEPSCAFPSFGMPTNSSLAYYVNTTFVYKLMKMGTDEDRPDWVADTDNVENDVIPYWALSKYFYHELGPLLKLVLVPMLVLFGLAVPYFIFDLITEFYRPNFLVPILNLFDRNIFFKIIIFILYFDMVVVTLLIFTSLLRKDLRKKLNKYGIQSLTEILITKENTYKSHAKDVLTGKHTNSENVDIYVHGHTHDAGLYDEIVPNKLYMDSGSWKQLMKRMPTRFRFPSVFVPYYALTYLQFTQVEDEIIAELKQWPKEFHEKLTLLEKIAVKKTKSFPKQVLTNKVLKKARLKMH